MSIDSDKIILDPIYKDSIRLKVVSKRPIYPDDRSFVINQTNYWKNLYDEVDKRSLKKSANILIVPKEIGEGKTSKVFRLKDLNTH